MGAFLGPVKFCEVPFASSPAVGCGGGGKWTCGVYWLRSRELTRAPVGQGQTYHIYFIYLDIILLKWSLACYYSMHIAHLLQAEHHSTNSTLIRDKSTNLHPCFKQLQ